MKIIALGGIKEPFLKDAIKEYQKRLTKYTKLEIIELEEETHQDKKTILRKEALKIKKAIKPQDTVILLDVKGDSYSSEEFASLIEKEQTNSKNITFLIGSSYGVDEDLKKEISKKITFSKMTFPHQLFRVILLEQIYRAFKIMNHEEYHK